MLVTVHGTWGGADDQEADLRGSWWQPDSLFMSAMVRTGIVPVDPPFEWSGDLDGLTGPTHHPFWSRAGADLRDRVAGIEHPVDAITHSHGLQVLAYAASLGARFRTVIDVEGPPRVDMRTTYHAAMPRIGRLVHLWNRGDRTILEGEVPVLISFIPTFPAWPNVINVRTADAYGHSGILEDVQAWDLGFPELGGLSLRLLLAPPRETA